MVALFRCFNPIPSNVLTLKYVFIAFEASLRLKSVFWVIVNFNNLPWIARRFFSSSLPMIISDASSLVISSQSLFKERPSWEINSPVLTSALEMPQHESSVDFAS